MERRRFLQLLGLFSGTTLLSSCGSEDGQKKLISYLVPPDDGVLPGEARWQVATCGECPAGCGLQVRLREERPVKLEGSPGHPVNDGALCVRGQASLWRLYHPERIRSPRRRDQEGNWVEIDWQEAFAEIETALVGAREEKRQSVYLAGRTTGTLADLIEAFCRDLGVERAPEFELFSHAAIRRANGLLFDRPDVPHYRLAEADFLLTVGADLLETFVSPVDFARQLAARRAEAARGREWLHLEPHYSLTGANADERRALRPGGEQSLLLYLLREVASSSGDNRLPSAIRQALPKITLPQAAAASGLAPEELESIRNRLRQAKKPLLVLGGAATARDGGLRTALLAGLLQWQFGMLGRTIDFDRSENYRSVGSLRDLSGLGERLAADAIGVLFLARVNPAYQAPDAFDFAARMKKASLTVALTDTPDETTEACDLLLPLSHGLESWDDRAPRRGLLSISKPAMAPLHDTRSEGEILLELRRLGGYEGTGDYREYLFARWQERFGEKDLERLAAQGYLETVPSPDPSPSLVIGEDGLRELSGLEGRDEELPGLSLQIVPSLRRFDGRSRAIPLLAEIPDPLTTVSWGSWLSVAAADARRAKLRDRDRVRLKAGKWQQELPVKIQPHQPPGMLVLQRDLLEGAPYGWDRHSGEATLAMAGLEIERIGERADLAVLAGSTSQKGRGIVPDPVHRKEHGKKEQRASLYPEHDHPNYRWAMAIDLDRCIGCSACAAACYIENNVPVVGKKEHLLGREMSWLRIEPFYDEEGGVEFVPMLCQHCHYAPCEPVCPVYAAYHNPEGLNVQVYNRCVGTRYCSNNCPYKVRRFNWWPHERPAPLDRMVNPDLSVRRRGMMEKCTFCIQRIRSGHDRARDEGRRIEDGDVVPACAQTCPADAIVFGNLNDEKSKVRQLAGSGRSYRIFEELGTESSVYYLSDGAASPTKRMEDHG